MIWEKLQVLLAHNVIGKGDKAITAYTFLFLFIGFLIVWSIAKKCQQFLKELLVERYKLTPITSKRIAGCARLILLAFGLIFIVDASELDISAAEILTYSDKLLNLPFVHIGQTKVTMWTVAYVLFLWTVLIVLSNKVQNFVAERLLAGTSLEHGVKHATSVILRYIFIALGFIVILQSAGVDLSALSVLAGALGLGLSFGLQNITSNLVSGLIVLFERPIKLGDRIEVAGVTGNVTRIALRATTICTNDNIEIIVPNSAFISSNVINLSHSSKDVRITVPVGVSYDSDPELVKRALLEVAASHKGVLAAPEPIVVFKAFGESSLDFQLRVSTSEYASTPGIMISELNFLIFAAFKKYNIEIPFPQRDLHIRSGNIGQMAAQN